MCFDTEMSELGNKIRELRAAESQREFAKRAGLSLRTICKLEAGELVSLETIRRLAQVLRLSEPERLEMVVSWLKLQLGEDFRQLAVEIRNGPGGILKESEQLSAKIQVLVSDLPRKMQEQLYLTLQRPEVLRCLPSLNQLYDSIKQSPR